MKKCPVCNAPVLGRSDKKFCSADCRAHHHHQKNRQTDRRIRSVHRVLRRNRAILEECIHQSLQMPDIRTLERKGFRFDYLTRRMENASGRIVCYCYDMAYTQVEETIQIYMESESGQSAHGN